MLHERNYCVTRRELLTIVTFVQQFQPYLLGAPFIRTDHSALAWIQKFKEPEGQIAQWVQKLQKYQFTIIHCPGNHHNNADALSRLPCRQCGMISVDEGTTLATVTTTDLASTMAYSPEELQATQLENLSIGLVLTSKEDNYYPDTIK